MDTRRYTESASSYDFIPTVGTPGLALDREGRRVLEINILYTTDAGTRAALKAASHLGADLGNCSRVLRLFAVPYSLPLDHPPVAVDFLERQMEDLTRESPMEIGGLIVLCREPRQTLHKILQPQSLIIIGGKKRWWPTKEQRLARELEREGFEVIFVESQ